MDYKERLKVIIQSLGFAGSRPEELCKPPCPGRTRIIKAALSPESEKPAPKKLSDHLPGCAALTTHDKDCDCSPAPDDGGRKP